MGDDNASGQMKNIGHRFGVGRPLRSCRFTATLRAMILWVSRFLTCVGLLFGMAALAVDNTLPPELAARGWEEIIFDGKVPNHYALCGEDCISIETAGSVSMIGLPVAVDLSRTPVLRWDWWISDPVAVTDLATKGQDDRALAIYVTFAYDPDRATLSEKLARPVIELAHGADAPGRVISYVWAGHGAQGDLVESPYFGDTNVMLISRTEADPVGQWISERVDVVEDHRRIFGQEPTRVAHILIASDSDDTETRLQGQVRDLGFAGE